MLTLKLTYANGDTDATRFNGTQQEAERYFLNHTFNIGCVADNLQKCTAVEVLPE